MFPAGLSLCVTRYYRSCGAGLSYHVKFEVHTHRRKEVESKHHSAVTSEQQRFDRTEIMFSLRKNGNM